MNTFTASNYYRVELTGPDVHDAQLRLLCSNGDEARICAVSSQQIDALRDFFRAQEDTRLGRWRWPENPNWVCYPAGNDVVVFNEDAPSFGSYTVFRGGDTWPYSRPAANAYFDAHPEPKPWESAADGEIWELISDGNPGQYLHDRGRFFALPLLTPSHPAWRPAGFASNFTAGRRIWPEDAS